MTSRASSDPSHARPLRPLGEDRIDVTDHDLARNLGSTVVCRGSWDRKGAPGFVQLALPER